MLTPRQLAGWIRFFNHEPWGFDVEEKRFLSIASLIADVDLMKITTRPPPPEPEASEAPPDAVVEASPMILALRKAFHHAEATTPLKPGVHGAGDSSSP